MAPTLARAGGATHEPFVWQTHGMAENDDRRVVGKPLIVAGGMTSTAEGIAELERKRAEIAKTNRPPPSKSFGSLMKARKEASEALDGHEIKSILAY